MVTFFFGLGMSGFFVAAVVRQAFVYRARSRERWPVVKGTVTSGDVLDVGGFYTGVVRYSYSMGPEGPYRGSDHRLEGRFESEPTPRREDAEAHLERYSTGETIDVFVDPAHPARSTLSRERPPLVARPYV